MLENIIPAVMTTHIKIVFSYFQADFDVFNALDLMDNKDFLSELKFGIGDGNLQYYLYNWRCPAMSPDQASNNITYTAGGVQQCHPIRQLSQFISITNIIYFKNLTALYSNQNNPQSAVKYYTVSLLFSVYPLRISKIFFVLVTFGHMLIDNEKYLSMKIKIKSVQFQVICECSKHSKNLN